MDMPRGPSSTDDRRSAGSTSKETIAQSPSVQQPLSVPLSQTKDQAAFRYLFRETSLESIHQCLAKVRDQEMVEYLQNGIIQIAELMSSEAFTGLERTRRKLRALRPRVVEDPSVARRQYDQHAENLGQLIFALGRRLGQFEEFLSSCPFSGSSELKRGLYGQRVRDLAGDIRFLGFELNLWVERCVPLRGDLPDGVEGRAFLEGRIGAVVDDLGLRLKEIQEVLGAAILQQLNVFDETLTRSKLFKRDIENVLDTDHLLSWLAELMGRVRDYDEQRRPEQLERVKTLLANFQPEQFPALSGIRESDHTMFTRFIPQIMHYSHSRPQKGDDPIHLFLLLLGDLVRNVNQTGAEATPFDPDF
jgi:hypothetical protein